jgi:hypothetical protein
MDSRICVVVLAALGCVACASAQDVHADADHRVVTPQPPLDWAKVVAPGELCATNQQYMAELAALGFDPLAAVCPPAGTCDEPDIRNAYIPMPGAPVLTVRLTIHVFCDNNGANCEATPQDVAVAVDRLNADFEPWNIQFVYESNFIKDTKFRLLDVQSNEPMMMKNKYNDSPATKLNVYVVQTSTGVAWGTFPWMVNSLSAQGGIVIPGFYFKEASPLTTILTHEVGHCLGLWHVFHGVDEVDPCSDCYEPAWRAPEIGDVTGDLCADTNPTPKNTNNCFDPAALDPCTGAPWVDTPYLNYMSYAHTCPIEFTAQQGGRMQCWTSNVLSSWLQLPAPPNVPGSPALSKLGGGQVLAAWSDNSGNENGFEVQRETKSANQWILAQIIANVGANVTSATDTPGSGTFRYRVRAYNDNGNSDWSSWTQIKN